MNNQTWLRSKDDPSNFEHTCSEKPNDGLDIKWLKRWEGATLVIGKDHSRFPLHFHIAFCPYCGVELTKPA
ncbi:MAG: hypothetical protein ABIG71_00860 [Candidatus Uhrbacteria bacterium]